MKENLMGLGICLAVIVLGAGLTWLFQHIPISFLLGQWPGFLIGIAVGVLAMLIGSFLKKRRREDDE